MGTDHEKAIVFHRVVCPESQDVVSITDKDLASALRFMISTATILEEMTRDMMENPNATIDYKVYEDKIYKYGPTFDGMMEDFECTVFGTHYNRRNKEQFIEMLATDGWKYFTIKNLNELFSIMLQSHGT